jgi:hypothetical protein
MDDLAVQWADDVDEIRNKLAKRHLSIVKHMKSALALK